MVSNLASILAPALRYVQGLLALARGSTAKLDGISPQPAAPQEPLDVPYDLTACSIHEEIEVKSSGQSLPIQSLPCLHTFFLESGSCQLRGGLLALWEAGSAAADSSSLNHWASQES